MVFAFQYYTLIYITTCGNGIFSFERVLGTLEDLIIIKLYITDLKIKF